MAPSPAERIRLEGTDPTDFVSGGVRRLVRGYVEAMTRYPKGFVLLLPDPEYPVPRPPGPLFSRVGSGRPVAAFRIGADGRVELLEAATPDYEARARACLAAPARLDAVGLPAGERGEASVVAFAMNVYDEFGIHVNVAPTG